MITRRQTLQVAAALPLAGLAGPALASAPLQLVATTGMIADAAAVIGGAFVEGRGLMGPGVDPHAYRQTRTDIVALTRADLVLWHGLYLEAQMEDFMTRLGNRQPVVAVAEAVAPDLLLAHADYDGRFDPHVWMDPGVWVHVVAEIQNALIAAAPENTEIFTTRAEAYMADIRALADYAAEITSTVPEDRRVLVTSHDAFSYFGRGSRFEVAGIQGISTASEAGLARIRELVDLLVDRQISAVFVESSVPARNIRALVEGAADRGHEVVVGGELFSDAMGEPGTYEGTYLGMIDHNVTTITRALGGQVPDRGRMGKLHAES